MAGLSLVTTVNCRFDGCSVFIGFPFSNWTTSSHVCTLPLIEQINISTIFNNSSNHMVYKNVERAWTGTVIQYTKWAAFIGCGRSLSPIDSGISVNTVEDCLKHCSDYSIATYFVIKNSRCYCLNNKPDLSGTCRTNCAHASNTPCSSDSSALVFIFVKDLKNIEPANTYIEKECITTTKDISRLSIRDCNARNLFGCKNTSSELISRSWYDYQEYCLTRYQISVLYNTNPIRNDAIAGNSYWTPIFRSHTVVDEIVTGKEVCLTVSKKESKYFIVENCTAQFPFLCSGVLVVAGILCVIIPILSMVIISVKAFRRIRIYQKKLQKVNEMLPGTEFSNYTGIEVANVEVHDSAYKELSDNVSPLHKHIHERRMDTSEDTVDYQGYLVPEQHYHTIPEVEVHYAESNLAESNPNKENVDSDDYLEPVI
ncbi:Hypothetical predicted protein [Mytilus galloprovincialis]|uniref:WSC domain-containing protein n=1 Tax=Mytilus galloprovincialis TaxID=29158 RepID=A0A8B6EJ35_MYTGA|nr:Hypothetical predicted protein [Mytilus galloprovincialis]